MKYFLAFAIYFICGAIWLGVPASWAIGITVFLAIFIYIITIGDI